MPAAANNTDLLYLEEKIKIAFTPNAEREMKKLTEKEEEKLSERCEELKSNTWQKIVNTERKKGLTPERREKKNTAYQKTLGRALPKHPTEDIYPFHFRVTQSFRAFGYQYKATLYITELDPKHKVHKRK